MRTRRLLIVIAQVLEEARRGPTPAAPGTVEEHVERQQPKELYEREF